MNTVRKLLSFQGRASRLEFWRWYLLSTLLAAVFWAASMFVALSELPGSKFLAAALLALIALLLFPWAAVMLRRLHDRNKGLPWLFVLGVLPYALAVTALALSMHDKTGVLFSSLTLVSLLLNLWSWVELGFLRGTRGRNRFGPEPSRR